MKTFKCTQNQLYIICFLAWKYYAEQLAAFTRFSQAYTSQVGLDAVKAIEAAQNLKNAEQRNFTASENRNKTIAAAKKVCDNWQTLRLYLIKVFEGDARQTCLNAAGVAYYRKSSANVWDAVGSLITDSVSFINDKKTELMANNNMPAGFADMYTADASACSGLLIQFKDSWVSKKIESKNKHAADNAVYETMTAMLADAKRIFKNDILKEKYTFSQLYKIAKSATPASLKGYITADGKPLPGVTVQINTRLKAVTNKKGFYSIARAAAASYIADISKTGFITTHEKIILKPGTAKHLNIQLQPIVAAQPVQMHPPQDDTLAQAV